MKRLLAIVFCLSLLGQMFAARLPAGCAARTVRACADCCGNMNCCAAKQNSNPQTPAVPSRTVSQNQFIFPASIALTRNPPASESTQNFSSANFSSAAGAVPIFQRDCAILI